MLRTLIEALEPCEPGSFFQIKDGYIKSTGSLLTYRSPIPMNIDCNPNATDFKSAVSKCSDTPIFSLTSTGNVKITSGPFKAIVNCSTGISVISDYPTGTTFELDGATLRKALKVILPFVSTVASNDRVWANGVLLRAGHCYATNNVILIQHETGMTFPISSLIPLRAIVSMLKIDGDPIKMQVDTDSVTFHYDDGKWLKSRLYVQKWDSRIFEMFNFTESLPSVDPRIFKAVSMVKSDTDNYSAVYFNGKGVSSSDNTDSGLDYTISDFNCTGVYNAHMMGLLDGVASHVDLSAYPEHAKFYGENLKGIICGMVK